MATQEQIDIARKLLEEKWRNEGECRSCGWHASLYEYEIDDGDIEEAIDNDWILDLCCLSKNHDDTSRHRGVRIRLKET